jgi:hypothetical protein
VNLASHSKRSGVASLLLGALSLVCLSGQVGAQCPVRGEEAYPRPGQSEATQGEPLLPEYGRLTDDVYSNLYFGFSFHLPIPLHGHRLMLPITLPGEHALLAVGFQEGTRYGTLKVTAGGHREEDDKRKAMEQALEQREDARASGGMPPKYLPDYTVPPLHLKHVDRHSGDVRGTQYSTRIRDYTVRFTVQTNDKSFLQKARDSIGTLRVFCADDSGRFFSPGGKSFVPDGTPTSGPTIPTAVVDEAIRSRPAERTIPEGAFSGGAFRVQPLEFSYALPVGWTVMPTPPDLIDEDAKDEQDRRLSYLWKSCARTWLRAIGVNGAVALDLRVLDQSCLHLPFPASANDTLAAESLGEYLHMLGHFGTSKSNQLIESGGRIFVVYEGTIAEGPPNQNLAQREVQVVTVTRYNKLIFAWAWSAPALSTIAQVPASRVTFGNSRPLAIGPSAIISKTSSQR